MSSDASIDQRDPSTLTNSPEPREMPRGGIFRHLLPRSVRGILIVLLLIVVIPRQIVEVRHYLNQAQERRDMASQANLELARSIAATLDAYVLDILHYESAIGDAFASPQPMQIEKAHRILYSGAQKYPSVRNFNWVSPQGRVVASSSNDLTGMNVVDRPYFREVIEGQEWTVSDLLEGMASGTPTFTISRRIEDENGVLQGVVVAALDPQRLIEVIKVERTGGASFGLIDRQGRLIYRYPEIQLSWEERNVIQAQPFIAPALAGQEVSGNFSTIPDQQNLISAYVPIRSIGWIAGVGDLEKEIMAPVFGELSKEIALDLFVVIAAFIIALVISRSITETTRRLNEYAAALGRGDRGSPGIVTGPIELKELGRSFEQMANEIRIREEALRETSQTLQALIEASPLPIIVNDTDGRIMMWNNAAERVFGWGATEVMGQPNPVVPEDKREEFRFIQNQLLQGNTFADLETYRQKKNGTLIDVNLSTAVLRDSTGKISGTVGIVSDITERKRAEQLREEYISLISHDLRAPLTIIQGQAQFLQRTLARAGSTGVEHRSAEAIAASAQRMNAMIQDLVETSRLEAGQIQLDKRPVDVGSLLTELLERSRLETDIDRISVILAEDLPLVSADPARLERILTNLLTNALKFSSASAEVTVNAVNKEGEIVISVTDRGVGIEPEDHQHIFERFYTAHQGRSSEGLGLGLYITKMLVEAHGGRIWLESEVGKGSTFFFSLPTTHPNT